MCTGLGPQQWKQYEGLTESQERDIVEMSSVDGPGVLHQGLLWFGCASQILGVGNLMFRVMFMVFGIGCLWDVIGYSFMSGLMD